MHRPWVATGAAAGAAIPYHPAMANEHPYPPCLSCGANEFVSIPEVAYEAHRAATAFGVAGVQRIGYWRATLVICAKCGHTDVFTTNTAELAKSVPGAMTFAGVPPRT